MQQAERPVERRLLSIDLQQRFPLRPWIRILGLAASLLLVAATILLVQRTEQVAASRVSLIHSYAVLDELNTIQTVVLALETEARERATLKEEKHQPLTSTDVQQLRAHVRTLKQLVSDSPAQLTAVTQLGTLAENPATDPATGLRISRTLSDITRRERARLVQRSQAFDKNVSRFDTLLVLTALAALLVVAVFLLVLHLYHSQTRRWQLLQQAQELEDEERARTRMLSAEASAKQSTPQQTEDGRKEIEAALVASVATSQPKYDASLMGLARLTSKTFACIVGVFGVIAIIGCVFNIDVLRNPTPWGRLVPMNSAICLLLTATGIWCANGSSKFCKPLAFTCGAIVTVIAGLTLGEWVFGWNPGIDQLIIAETHLRFSQMPGRMSVSAALCFSILGAGLLTLSRSKPRVSQAFAFIAFCIGLVTLTGHSFALASLTSFGGETVTAFPISVSMALLGVGLMLVAPQSGIAYVMVSPSLGGRVFRRVVPLLVLTPALGLVTGIGVPSPLDLPILAVTVTIFFPVIIWAVAVAMDRLDRQKDEALERTLARRQQLETSTRQLEAARDQALEASNLKSAFVANISHELRTPLSGIIGNIELLLSTADVPTDERHGLQATLGAAESLLQIVNDLLDISKIESGKLTLEYSTFDLPAMVGTVIDTMADVANRKGLRLVLDRSPNLPQFAVGDEGRLRQILFNLLSNAIKFTSEGTIAVCVKPEDPCDKHLCRVRFEVRDTGIGISPDDQRRLFQRFSQIDSSATRKFGGTGLGLSLCKNLVDLMGGTIGVASTPGKGSAFWFVVSLGVQEAPLPARPKNIEPIEPVPEFKNHVVLVVEDNMLIQRVILKQLSALGLTALMAPTGSTALDMVSSVPIDAILMDCNLPDISGIDVTKEIRKLESQTHAHVPIIAMTAAAMAGDREYCLSAGMDDYLSKPVTIEQLRNTLARWLGTPKKRAIG